MGYEPDKWILSNYSKIHSSIPSFFLILLHLLSSFILKLSVLMPIKSQNQVKNQAMKSKAKIMLDEFVYQWKKVVWLIPNGL